MNPSQTLLREVRVRRGLVFGVIIITALFAFEIFNYSTTEFALSDLLGDLKFMGIRWATILAIAFCGIDFAGIARLFSPTEPGNASPNSHNENWYLFGAWLLAATMNAMLTWWGVSLAVLEHQSLGNEVASREALLRIVPIFVAVLVWLIRVLIIGAFSAAGDRLFYADAPRVMVSNRPQPRPANTQQMPASATGKPATTRSIAASPSGYRTANPSVSKSNSTVRFEAPAQERPEPTYHTVSNNPVQPANGNGNTVGMNRPNLNRPGTTQRYPR